MLVSMNKRILVTGAAGFIGFHLSRHLKSRGDQVLGLDNFNAYYDPTLKRQRAQLLKDTGVNIVEGDVCDVTLLDRLVEENQITHLVHLAAQAGVRYSIDCPDAYLKANLDGFLQILECCRRHPGIPLVYASSSSVYGRNKETPFSIKDRTDHQASLYGVTKKANELMADAYHHLYQIPVTGLRFFTVYGPWGRPDMAYFSFAKRILDGETIDLFNNGDMERDFTYIDDIVAGTAAAIDRKSTCDLFNLGNHNPEPLLNLVKCLESSLGVSAKTRCLPMQPGDVKATYADISRSRLELGFEPTTSLADGIFQFSSWFKEWRSSKNDSIVVT
jgi:UDP-glucuronate 4-epimerase